MTARPKLQILGLALSALICVSEAAAQDTSLSFLNRVLGEEESESAKSEERLAGGTLLLTDDPANSAVYDAIAGQVRNLASMIRNDSDMLSYYRLQDSVLGEVIDLMQRIRELLVQGSNGIYADDDREEIDSEIGQDYDQVAETLGDAEFNRQRLFTPSESGAIAGLFEHREFHALNSVDGALQSLLGERTSIGARAEALGFAVSGREGESLNAAAAQSQGDTDFAKELTNLERHQILMLADILMLKR
jgi:flagellin